MELVLRVGGGICRQGPYMPRTNQGTIRDDDCAPAQDHRTIRKPDDYGFLFHSVQHLSEKESLLPRWFPWSLPRGRQGVMLG